MSDAHPAAPGARGDADAPLTYQSAGVDIDRADAFVARIQALTGRTMTPRVKPAPGGFAGFYSLEPEAADDGLPVGPGSAPMLVACTDGVGTKLKIAFALDRHDTVGIDLVAMNVNDALAVGARPLFFLDYFATGRLSPDTAADVVAGIAAGCEEAGCALIGGETAEMPGFYDDGEYDLAGFTVGLVDRSRIIDGATIRPGDVVIGLPSSGLHSNGFSLARKALLERAGLQLDAPVAELGRTLGEELLSPTRIYVKPVLAMLADAAARPGVTGLAHITGGGLIDNVRRILPAGCAAQIQRSAWTRPPVFGLIESLGGVPDAEMWRVFNQGIGFVIVARPESADAVTAALEAAGAPAQRIGRIISADERSVEISDG
jgi:phosphoribosylformylglycinamidine cyclo-ligase